MVNASIKPGKDVGATDGTPDVLMTELLKELGERYNFIEESKALLENAPLEDEFQVDEEQGFNGLEQLRNMSRNNYAKLIVSATTDRLGILGFRTGAAREETGDRAAMEAFEEDGMAAKGVEAMGLACSYRSAYLHVDPIAKRQMVVPPTNGAVIPDRYGEPVASIVLTRDRFQGFDFATLYLRDVDKETGEATGKVKMFTASKELPENYRRHYDSGLRVTSYDSEVPLKRSMTSGWVWWKQKPLTLDRIPVSALKNKDGLSEFEDHIDVINRINHMIFQRVIIATMQAFRQRAVIGNFPDKDPVTKAKIDYEQMFASGPAQMWTLPEGAQMWESAPPSFQDILSSVKDDTRDLASQTYTPMSYFSDSANNSAEGAALQRENYISKIEDRRSRFSATWKRHISILFETKGDKERSEMRLLEVIWKPVQVESLSNRVAAYATMRDRGLAMSTALREAMGWTPPEIRRAQSEAVEERLTAAVSDAMSQATPLERSSYGQNAESQARAASGGGENK